MRWQTNFYDFSFKRTTTAGIRIHPTKAWLSQLVSFKNAIWTLEERYAIKFCFKLGKNTMWFKLDLPLWPRDQETEFPVEACWLSQAQEGQTEQIHPQNFWWSLFLTALAWSTCTGFPLDKQSTKNTMLRKRFRQKRPVLFKSGQWHFPELELNCYIVACTTWLPVLRKYKRRRITQARRSRSRKRSSEIALKDVGQ